MIIVIDLQYLSSTEENAALIPTLVKLFVQVGTANRLLYLGNGLTSQDSLIDHACSSQKENVT